MAKKKQQGSSKQDTSYWRVVHWFFAHPTTEISLNDLAKKVNISKTTAHDLVSALAQEKFLKVQTLGKVWRISCNQQHPLNSTVKISYNLNLLYHSGIIEEVLRFVPSPRAIILFGSYRKGDDIETSDLDLAVETLEDDEVKILPLRRIPQLGYRKNVNMNILQFSRKKIDLNLFANIANGIVLHGFLEARP